MWLENIIFFILLLIRADALEVGEECIPINNMMTDGVCRLVHDCAVALRAIQERHRQPFNRCGFSGKTEIVCCPRKTESTTKKPTVQPMDKFGDTTAAKMIADRECQKIVETSLPPLSLHIIGGENVSLGEFPYMAALGYERTDGYDFLCGGSLISNTFILTAAHCVDTLDQVKPSIARLGVIDIADREFNESTDIRVQQIIQHPSYMRRTKYHDLALLRLEKPVETSTEVNPICLYTKPDNPTIPLTVTGWGKTSNTRDVKSEYLLKANVTAVDSSKCSESYTNWRKLPDGISNDQICAGDPQGLRDTCQGDSGGPLQGFTERDGQYRLVGVTSFGRGCGSLSPGVYTRVAQYLDWIVANVWPN